MGPTNFSGNDVRRSKAGKLFQSYGDKLPKTLFALQVTTNAVVLSA